MSSVQKSYRVSAPGKRPGRGLPAVGGIRETESACFYAAPEALPRSSPKRRKSMESAGAGTVPAVPLDRNDDEAPRPRNLPAAAGKIRAGRAYSLP